MLQLEVLDGPLVFLGDGVPECSDPSCRVIRLPLELCNGACLGLLERIPSWPIVAP